MLNDLSIYEQTRSRMQTGDRISVRSSGIIGSGIRFFTKDEKNHEAMIVRFTPFEATGMLDRVYILEAVARGADLVGLGNRVGELKGQAWWHPLKPEFEPYRDVMAAVGMQLSGTHYDVRAYPKILRSIILKTARVSTDMKYLFCSEWLYVCGRDAGLPVPEGWPRDRAPYPGREIDQLGWWGAGVPLLPI